MATKFATKLIKAATRNEKKDNNDDHDAELGLLLESGKYSDLTLTCKGRSFKVHKAIVCSRSKPLAAAVDTGFLEASTGIIHLDDDDQEIIACMIDFLYTRDYNDKRQEKTNLPNQEAKEKWEHDQSKSLLLNASVYTTAEKYDIKPLKKHAMKKYQQILPHCWRGASFIPSLRLMYEMLPSSDTELKKVATIVAAKHLGPLLEKPSFIELCMEFPEISVDCLGESAKRTTAVCPKCGKIDYVVLNHSDKTGARFLCERYGCSVYGFDL